MQLATLPYALTRDPFTLEVDDFLLLPNTAKTANDALAISGNSDFWDTDHLQESGIPCYIARVIDPNHYGNVVQLEIIQTGVTS